MIRIFLLRCPKEIYNFYEPIEILRIRMLKSSLNFQIIIQPSPIAISIAEKLSNETDWKVEINQNLIELSMSQKEGVSKLDYLLMANSNFGGKESVNEHRLRVEAWFANLIANINNCERNLIICADALTLEHIHNFLACIPAYASLKSFTAHEPFHFHVWTGDIFQNTDYIWCLRAVNTPINLLEENLLPLNSVYLISKNV